MNKKKEATMVKSFITLISLLACLHFGTACNNDSGVGEGCWKQFHIAGTVKDNTDNALEGVNVSINGFTNTTVTSVDGTYLLDIPESMQTMGSLDGYKVKFEKVGFLVYEATPFSHAEGSACGDVNLVRDAVLQP